jgi:hypothetical protein
MTTYSAILTNAGAALYAAAVVSGIPIVLNTFVIGDGGGSPVASPDPTRATLVNQVYSGTINSITPDLTTPNLVWFECDIPPSVGGFTVREAGLVTSLGALFAISNYPDTIKPVVAGGSASDLIINLGLVFSNTALVTLSIDPSVVGATRAWVEATITPAYILPGGTQYQALQKNSSTGGDFSWVDQQSPWILNVSTTGGVVNVSALQANNKIIKVTGALTSDVTLTFVEAPGKWIVVNDTTGAHALNAIGSGESGVPVLQGFADFVYCDGVNIFYSSSSAITKYQFDNSLAMATTAYVDAVTKLNYDVPTPVGYGSYPATFTKVGDIDIAQFSKSLAQSIIWKFAIPATVNLTKAIKLRLHFTGDSASGNYYMQLGYQIMAVGSAVTPASYTNEQEAMAAPGTIAYLMNYLTSTIVIPANSVVVGDIVVFVLTRLSTNVSDTNTGNLQLANIKLEQ